ncbi:MAG: ATPase [Proteobacteria bacterium]|nr:ATPase [Pseudomonadota bacterium]NOG59402.1 ATPase [Pseudomonadota bacterium]
MSNCCHKEEPKQSCHETGNKRDYLLISTSSIIIIAYLFNLLPESIFGASPYLKSFVESSFTLINTMYWGILIGILFIALLGQIPREFIIALLGRKDGIGGVIRATFAGVLLDLCSHGILMVGSKLYQKGASTGQVMAFLIASPWNSFSLTLILWALIGFKWMIVFLIASMLIGIISGLIFELLVKRNVLPDNPNRVDIPEDFKIIAQSKLALKRFNFTFPWLSKMLLQGVKDSRMVLRWIFLGIILASLIRTFVSLEFFQTYFGPSLIGLALTLLAATVIEVCSEGSVPISADLLTRANAPGNSFTFLMAGVATDYTEIMVLKDTTGRWIIPLFLPLVTLPQILLLGFLFNHIN